MRSVDEHLIRRKEKLVLLFTPPFDQSRPHPGYIMGYPPGVRENGGQYTHAALWVAMAYARMGQGGRAVEVLQMLNPIEHTHTAKLCCVSNRAHVALQMCTHCRAKGPRGWTWYTGSAGWKWRISWRSVRSFVAIVGHEPAIPEEGLATSRSAMAELNIGGGMEANLQTGIPAGRRSQEPHDPNIHGPATIKMSDTSPTSSVVA
jgi:hypothetical protein